MIKNLIIFSIIIFFISGCITDPNTGEQRVSKTVPYGLGAAATCGIIGAIAKKDSKSARNAALGCGAIGVGVGAYMDHQEKILRDKLKDTPVNVKREGDNIHLTMPNNITFETNSYNLSSYVRSILDEVSQVLAKYNETKINVIGHTDSTGNDVINIPLSKNRANAVSAYLVSHGVDYARINSYGVGSSQPKADNSTAAGRAQNRRVEVVIGPDA